MATESRARSKPNKADLELKVLQAEARRHNASADVYELKAAEERRLQEEGQAAGWANRVFSFVEPVYGESVAHCMDTLSMWSRLEPGCDITVILNSPGGLIFEGLALYDFFDELKRDGHTLTIIVRGIAASMGSILLQAASPGERVIGRNAHVMIHELSDMAYGKHSDIKDATKFNERLNDRLIAILAERSTLSRRTIKNRSARKDWWLDADECVDHGFADRVG
jgi:ATP-dependent Clp endopeptidase proteolytic subunit ClpP